MGTTVPCPLRRQGIVSPSRGYQIRPLWGRIFNHVNKNYNVSIFFTNDHKKLSKSIKSFLTLFLTFSNFFDLCHQNKALIFIDICITKFTVCFSFVIGIKIALEKKIFFFIKCVRISKKITLYIIEAIFNDSHY